MVQKRLRWAAKPTARPAQSERMKGACCAPGAFERVEQNAALALAAYLLGSARGQGREPQHDGGQNQAGDGVLALAAAQGKALAEEERAHAHTDDEPGQAEQGVRVAAGQAQDDAPGAARKTSAPMPATAPSKKRVMGAEPPRGLYSPKSGPHQRPPEPCP